MKYKKIPKEYIKTCIDRLTRFKPVCEKYTRVFDDILNKFLISAPVDFSGSQDEKNKLVCEIFIASVPFEFDSFLSEVLAKEEEKTFVLGENEKAFLNSGLNFTGAIKYISDDVNLPKNLAGLCALLQNRKTDLDTLRKEKSFLYPVKKVILTEGATEEILLSRFAKKLGFDFDKEGVLIIGAGGKNQVARKYYKMADEIKLPVFILLDFDADETKELIEPKLKEKDKIYLIKAGEFEDILPLDLIIKSINSNFSNNLHCDISDFNSELKMTKNLHILFKNKGFGEYKKADFAKMVKSYMEDSSFGASEISSEIVEIINGIKTL